MTKYVIQLNGTRYKHSSCVLATEPDASAKDGLIASYELWHESGISCDNDFWIRIVELDDTGSERRLVELDSSQIACLGLMEWEDVDVPDYNAVINTEQRSLEVWETKSAVMEETLELDRASFDVTDLRIHAVKPPGFRLACYCTYDGKLLRNKGLGPITKAYVSIAKYAVTPEQIAEEKKYSHLETIPLRHMTAPPSIEPDENALSSSTEHQSKLELGRDIRRHLGIPFPVP